MNAFFPRFAGKRALVMGLGLFSGGVEAVRFLHGCGCSEIVVTDLRDARTLARSLAEIEPLRPVLRLGEHRDSDFARAEVVIHSPAVRPDHRLLQLARDAGAEVTLEMSLFIEACKARTVGITGSNGKTTTTLLCYEMLRRRFAPAPGQADLWTEWADGVDPARLPDCVEPPRALDRVWLGGNLGRPLLNRLSEIRPADVVVLELSSFQLMDWHRIRRSCDIGVITNVTPNHLDWHRDFDEYARAKSAVFAHKPGNVAILNLENDVTRALGRQRQQGRERVDWFSLEAEPGLCVVEGAGREVVASGRDGRLALRVLEAGEVEAATRDNLRVPGDFNWANACAAAAAACAVDEALALEVSAALETFRGAQHRLEPCGVINGARIYNDSIATDPQATLAALGAFVRGVRLILGGGSKNIDYGELGARIATHGGIRAVYLQGTTAPVIRAAIEKAEQVAGPALVDCAGFDEACARAFDELTPGEVLLMSPASTSFYEFAPGRKFANFEERGAYFKALVRAREQRV
jgi:UDP-N-acetylmuramoylalanine--D-glutamate ligase